MVKVFLCGNLGSDAKSKQLEDDRFVINFSVADNQKKGDKEITQWFNCSYFVKNNNVINYLVKGHKVAVVGDLTISEYRSSQTNEVKISSDILVNSLQILEFADKTE